MCCRRVRLMWPTIAASVVVLPTPVAPVTRISPRCSSDSVSTPGGRRRLLKSGTVRGMTRKASEISPRWRNALTRKRGRPDRLVGGVELAGALEDLEPRGRGGADVIHDLPQLERAERGKAVERLELAVEADDRRPAGLQVDVAGAAVDGGAEDLVEVDGWFVMWLSASELDGCEESREWKRAGQSVRARRREGDRRELERAALSGVDAPVDADDRAGDDASPRRSRRRSRCRGAAPGSAPS